MIQAVLSSFSVLRNLNFRIYLSGQAVSLIGTWLQSTAQGWVVWKLTGSTVELGAVSMLATLPMLLLGPWTGAWADRYDRRKLLIGSQVVMMILAFVLSVLVLTNSVQLWHIYVLSLLLGIATAVDMPAQQAFLGDLAGTGEVRKAVNVNIMILQVSRILGPALAGVIVAAVGAGLAFFLNGLSFLAVIYSLMMVRRMSDSLVKRPTGSALSGFVEALDFVRGEARLRDLFIFGIMMTFFALSIVMNILPAVANEVLKGEADLFGVLMSSSGAGALVGVVVIAPWVQSFKRTGVVLSVMTIIAALGFELLGLSTVPAISMAALFFAGLAVPSVMTTVMGLLQVNTPIQMRARVMGLFSMVSLGFQPIAALWIGWSAEHFGIQSAILMNATLLIIGALVMLSRASLRQWEASANSPAVVAAAD